jgi:hypothetical protein
MEIPAYIWKRQHTSGRIFWEIDKTGEIRLVEQGAMRIALNRAELN